MLLFHLFRSSSSEDVDSTIRYDPFITFAGRGRVPKSERSKRGCVNLVL